MNTIKVFDRESTEHKRLEVAASLMTLKSPCGYRYEVGETYFDFGQGWRWTTVLKVGKDGWQALSPREQEDIVSGDIDEAVESWLNDKYNPDREERRTA